MSVAAMVALAHDLIITVGVYALTGFEVTPATVTGVLTILGYSLYDTVVVFDKVRENTKGIATSTRRTYSEAANLAVNQTLVRSINTSIAALLPVAAILYVGTFQLGSGPLKDLALRCSSVWRPARTRRSSSRRRCSRAQDARAGDGRCRRSGSPTAGRRRPRLAAGAARAAHRRRSSASTHVADAG